MLAQTHLQQQSTIRLLLSGILAVSILWLLAVGNIESSSGYAGSNKDSNGIVVSTDMPLHANSEHSFTLKRFFSRYKDQPKSAEPPEPIWALAPNDIIALLPRVTASSHNAAAQHPHISLHRLQTLNISRAPPLV